METCLENFPVKDEDDNQGSIERGTSSQDLIENILRDDAFLFLGDPFHEILVLPSEDRSGGNNDRHCPNGSNQGSDRSRCP